MKLITKDNSYLSKRNINSVLDYKECLARFSENFNQEVSLKSATPIFLDTNVLLRYYSISFTAREKLFEFIKGNNARIVLSSQVQFEFLKNREDVIQRFFEQVTNKIPKDFNTDVMNKMNNFLDQHKIVLKDYPFVEAGIQKHKDELEKLFLKLNDTAEQKKKEHVDLIVKDKFLELLTSCKAYDGLSTEELDLIKKDFDVLAKSTSSDNLDAILNKPYMVFPGAGDIKNKPEDPYGDYVIFHEMMKYMLNVKTDVIFLTFDNTKGDWMTRSKNPHLHYTQNMYANTGHILYIFDAERTLGDLLNVNIESLVSTEQLGNSQGEITVEGLKAIMENHPMFVGIERGLFSIKHVQEMHLNGYETIDEIEKEVERAAVAAMEYRKIHAPTLNTVGVLRSCLKICNPSYGTIKNDGTKRAPHESFRKIYWSFRHLLMD